MSQILNVAQKARLSLFSIFHRVSEGVPTLDSLKGVIARGVVASTRISERLSKEFPHPSLT
ncbi:hypothetical protein DSO57_1018182 [Entomophthora muscae]|uniref:Uncharacterized protein n=1 Tax=Entomophthora muscae TaxID=34485 RepID=A0ACC2RIV4_9FUNG|nr:hypothetical protein DSO57_1018182 [Entomophthora muscae]